MLIEFLKALGFIFIAEMGDKTQILAMAFATKYKVKMVLLGILLGSFLNHGLAVLLGSYLSNIIPIQSLQMVAGFAFVAFSLWTLQMDEDDGEEEGPKKSLGPVLTVATAFFVGELGDKTQLTAITLAADASYPALILMGTVAGMIVTGGLGIYVGKKIGDRIPELAIKFIAASIFMFFGILKLLNTVPSAYTYSIYGLLFVLLIMVIGFIRIRKLLMLHKHHVASKYRSTSERLRIYHEEVEQGVQGMCLGEHYCGTCEREWCIVGWTKELIKSVESQDNAVVVEYGTDKIEVIRDAKKERVLEALVTTLRMLNRKEVMEQDFPRVRQIRQNFETILWGNHIKDFVDMTSYKTKLETLHPDAVCSIQELWDKSQE